MTRDSATESRRWNRWNIDDADDGDDSDAAELREPMTFILKQRINNGPVTKTRTEQYKKIEC